LVSREGNEKKKGEGLPFLTGKKKKKKKEKRESLPMTNATGTKGGGTFGVTKRGKKHLERRMDGFAPKELRPFGSKSFRGGRGGKGGGGLRPPGKKGLRPSGRGKKSEKKKVKEHRGGPNYPLEGNKCYPSKRTRKKKGKSIPKKGNHPGGDGLFAGGENDAPHGFPRGRKMKKTTYGKGGKKTVLQGEKGRQTFYQSYQKKKDEA